MNKISENKAITLIALVVTIIVLLILAGITINMVVSENDLFGKARNAVEKTKEASIKEEVELAMGELQMDYYISGATGDYATYAATQLASGVQTTNGTLKLNGTTISYTPKGASAPTATGTFDTTTGRVTITSTTTDAPTPAPTYTKYTLGQEVTVGGEQFFVIEENDTTSKDTITLITKYNLDPSSNTQLNATYGSTAMAFCTDPDDTDEGYWASISGITYPYELNGVESERATVYNKAKAYGTAKGGIGRLLTKTEAETLTAEGKIPKIIYGQDYTTNPVTTDNFLPFWLGTAYSSVSVYGVSGEYSTLYFDYFNSDDDFCGVRPVITISKSLVL